MSFLLLQSFFILSLLPTPYSLSLDAVTPEAGLNSPIYPNTRVYASWQKTKATDPSTFTINVWWWTDALTPFASNVNINSPAGTILESVGNIDGPGTYNLAVFVDGTAIATSPVFTVVASPAAPASTTTPKSSSTSTEKATTSPTMTNIPVTTPTTTSSSSSSTGSSSSSTETSTSSSSTTNTAIITFAAHSSAFTSAQSSATNAAITPEQNNQSPNTSSKKTPVGAIAGGAIGGVVLLLGIGVLLFFLVRRRKRTSDAGTVDLLEDHAFDQPIPTDTRPFEKRGRLEAVIREREEAQRQQDLLRADLQSQRTSHLQDREGPTQREALLMQQNQLLAERIVALESQQREIEDRLAEDAPPDYATTYRPVSRIP